MYKPSRAQLSKFLPDPETVRAFEALFNLAAGDDGAIAALQSALGTLTNRVTVAEIGVDDGEINDAAVSAQATASLQAIDRLREALELVALAPPVVPYIAPAVTPGGSGNAVNVVCDFGASFTDKAQTVVTGEAWVTGTSVLNAEVLTNSGTDPDEMYLLGIRAVVSDIVPGDGFTITLYSEAEARGTYTVMVSGV